MVHLRIDWIAGALGLVLLVGACVKDNDGEAQPPSGSATKPITQTEVADTHVPKIPEGLQASC